MWDFGPEFFEWWAGLSPLVRYGVAVLLITVGGVLCYFTDGGYWSWDSWLVAGTVLLLFAGRSKDE